MDLTTLSAVKQYLGTSTNVDALVAQLIPRESRLIETYTSRVFPSVSTANKRLDGTGSAMLMLPASPIISITALTVCGRDVPAAASDLAFGYLFDDTTLYMAGGAKFPRGRQNVVVSWESGYAASVEAIVPAGNAALLINDPGTPGTITSVVAADGTVYAATTSNTPAAHQYYFNRPNLFFNAADAGVAITVAMRYIPAQVEQSCIEMVGLDIKQRDNLGIKSKMLASEQITYEGAGLTASCKEMLQGFRRLAPV